MMSDFPAGSLVTLEEFFEGNSDLGSIGCNLSEHPGIWVFYKTLKRIKARPDVQDVLVHITESAADGQTDWPFSDHVYIISSAGIDELSEQLTPLQPDPVTEGLMEKAPDNFPPLREGMRVICIWWD